MVKKRTISAADYGSHVMQYGDSAMSKDVLGLYFGASSTSKYDSVIAQDEGHAPMVAIDQRDADFVYLREKVLNHTQTSD